MLCSKRSTAQEAKGSIKLATLDYQDKPQLYSSGVLH
jgi:hypothetical protein